jgi:hypothetical protein
MPASKLIASGFIPPCIPTRAVKPPAGADWVHEIKHDGYRLQVPGRRGDRRGASVGQGAAQEGDRGGGVAASVGRAANLEYDPWRF